MTEPNEFDDAAGRAKDAAPLEPKLPAARPAIENGAGYGENNKIFTKEQADKAREKLREILNPNRVNSGIDPE